MSDAELLERLRSHREAGMEALLAQYAPLLRYVICGVLRDPQDAEDCYSEVTLNLWQRLDGYDPQKGGLSAYLTATARNTALNHLKARLRREKHLAEQPEPQAPATPEQALLHQERMEQLKAAIAGLPSLDRKLFYRRYYYLQPVAQIAAELGMSQRAIEGRLYRLRQKLRQELGGDGL
ncbi:MAG: RNA polymerase sigma factor [Dysosmobacter sp.]